MNNVLQNKMNQAKKYKTISFILGVSAAVLIMLAPLFFPLGMLGVVAFVWRHAG